MSQLESLTDRQRTVYEFIRDKIRNRGYGPTVREIGEHFEISSPNGVMCHLNALEKKGLITREPNMSRAIQLAAEPIEEKGLPLAGRIAAGVLHEAIEQTERVELSKELERLAATDSLTGLANRRRFETAVDDELRRALREGTPLTVMLVDVDLFKAYNDEHGHHVGAKPRGILGTEARHCKSIPSGNSDL